MVCFFLRSVAKKELTLRKLITDGIHIGKYDVDNSNSGINSYNNKNKNQMKIENINNNTTNCCLTGKVDFHFHLHVT